MSGISFSENSSNFGKILKKRVYEFLRENKLEKQATWKGMAKAFLILISAFLIYIQLVFGSISPLAAVLLCILLGITVASIGFNLLHEAVHGNFTKNPKLGNLIRYSWELLGASNRLYNFRHVIIHHSFTNISGTDADIETGGLLRLCPSQEHKRLHRYQHIYAPFLYMMITLDWVWHGDYEGHITCKLGSNRMARPTKQESFIFYTAKLAHLIYALIIPCLFHSVLSVLGCYLLAQMVAGLILGIVFSLAHVYDEATFPQADPKTQRISEGWADHQVRTTKNFANSNRFLRWYLGGLNYQVEHHLFPRLYNGYYPLIKPIVMQTCKEFGLEYQEFKTVRDAVSSHFRHLYQMGLPATVVSDRGVKSESPTLREEQPQGCALVPESGTSRPELGGV